MCVVPGDLVTNQNAVVFFFWNCVIPLDVDGGRACVAVCENCWTNRGNYAMQENKDLL